MFSGDLKSLDELLPLLDGGCDILLCETGHHRVADVCRFAEDHGVKRLVFVHHGREILQGRKSVDEALEGCTVPVEIAYDGMKMEF